LFFDEPLRITSSVGGVLVMGGVYIVYS
jgi:hypothetical protein